MYGTTFQYSRGPFVSRPSWYSTVASLGVVSVVPRNHSFFLRYLGNFPFFRQFLRNFGYSKIQKPLSTNSYPGHCSILRRQYIHPKCSGFYVEFCKNQKTRSKSLLILLTNSQINCLFSSRSFKLYVLPFPLPGFHIICRQFLGNIEISVNTIPAPLKGAPCIEKFFWGPSDYHIKKP